ncbi:acyl-CoA reductase [Clostridium sp. UBA1056]|uniref:acyl-CoA reductase n=1 Tax=unclassified Clostridium TaxID=2614128 RepID=UPI003217E222
MNLNDFKHIFWGNELALNGEITSSLAKEYFDENILNTKSREFSHTPIDKILYVLEKTAYLICDKEKSYYKELLYKLPTLINYSPSMVELGLIALKEMLSIPSLKQRLKSLGDYHSLDNFTKGHHGIVTRTVPLGSILHIAAGNIFLGSIDSLVMGIITKNLNILKVSSQDFLFPSLFFKALCEADSDRIITPYICITYWKSSNHSVDEIIKNSFDAILLFGGEDSVAHYKNNLSPKTQLYSFGPKISFGLITKDVKPCNLQSIADGFADDIVLWEQRACTSCQNIFIEESENLNLFVSLLYNALEKKGMEFPQTTLDIDSAVEIRKKRELANWSEFNNDGLVLEGTSANHTIIVQRTNNVCDSPLNRTIYVNIIDNYKDVLTSNISSLKYYMSTLAIACDTNIQDIMEDFMHLGVMRFCKPGFMCKNADESFPHDGFHLINLLVHFINKEDISIDDLGVEYTSTSMKDEILLSRLNLLLNEALKSPFYKELYKDITFPLKSLDKFKNLPTLEKQHIYDHSIDKNFDMLTAPANNSYTFSAGGTTGKMKYVAYSNEEFRESRQVFGQGFRAVGIDKNDFVVNYMKSGALWTAFTAVNEGLEETNCRILSLTSNQPEKETIQYLKTFSPNVLISLPGNIVLLAQEVEKLNESISFEKIFYAGEHMSFKAQEYVKKIFNCSKIASFGYAAVEIGPIGFQCECCSGTEHHVMDNWCYVEHDENGDVLVTGLKRFLHPIIRYRLGDNIEWIDEPCSCKRTSKKFRLLSRTDDLIRFNVSDIYINDVYDALKDIEEVSPFFQITVNNIGEMRSVSFKIETKDNKISLNDNLKSKVISSLEHQIKCISADREKNLIKDFNVELVHPLSIERVSRTGKIRKIIDNRL